MFVAYSRFPYQRSRGESSGPRPRRQMPQLEAASSRNSWHLLDAILIQPARLRCRRLTEGWIARLRREVACNPLSYHSTPKEQARCECLAFCELIARSAHKQNAFETYRPLLRGTVLPSLRCGRGRLRCKRNVRLLRKDISYDHEHILHVFCPCIDHLARQRQAPFIRVQIRGTSVR